MRAVMGALVTVLWLAAPAGAEEGAPEAASAPVAAPEAAEPAPTPTGAWTGVIDWDNPDWPDSHGMGWTFEPNGTFSSSDQYLGVWSQYGDRVVWIYIAEPNSLYEMRFATPDQMVGKVHNREGASGVVTLQRVIN